MKKLVMLASLVLALTVGSGVQASVGDKLLLYIPNRLVDFVDIISLSMGFGPAIRVNVHATRVISFGGGVGATAKAIKAINRQYGAGLESGWETSFMMISAESKELKDNTRGVKSFNYYSTGVPSTDEKIYEFYDGARDYWSIGVAGAAGLVELDAEFHPVEFADFFTGFLFIDLKGDDFTSDNLRI